MNGKLENKVVVVTGGTRGIGFMTKPKFDPIVCAGPGAFNSRRAARLVMLNQRNNHVEHHRNAVAA